MSVHGNYAGNPEQPVHQVLTNTSLTDIGDAAKKMVKILASVAIANPSGSGVDCSLYWYKAATATDHLIWFKTVPTKDTLSIADLPVRLAEGDKIKAIGDNTVCVTLFYLDLIPLNRPTV
ncbi:hypothetical protein [Ensifer adhaerens]|uniref:hypothetical protein n=1 Tax=Ensifer adhaerens TaxID=106592 RepID=UPI000CF16567|nr:hypothetical protein [Ensifer adhaerens]